MTAVEPRPLADQVAEVVLDSGQEWLRYWPLDDGSQVRTTWHAQDHVSIHQDGDHLGDFHLEVKAHPIPLEPLGPEDDGALQAELADAHRHATTPQPELGGKSPADLILQVLEAARDMAADHGGLGAIFSGPAHRLQTALDSLDAALDREAREAGQPESGHWHPATWRDVKEGDRIRVGGQHEAEVEVAMEVTFLGSGAAQVPVKLKDRGHYTMPPSGPVEVWKPSLPEWAAQAYLALADAKLVEVESRG